MNITLVGIILVVFGLLYLRSPTMYRRGIWLKTSVAIRLLSEENYKKYMRILGAFFIVGGTCLIGWEQLVVRFGIQ
jgi:hypothetical protein